MVLNYVFNILVKFSSFVFKLRVVACLSTDKQLLWIMYPTSLADLPPHDIVTQQKLWCTQWRKWGIICNKNTLVTTMCFCLSVVKGCFLIGALSLFIRSNVVTTVPYKHRTVAAWEVTKVLPVLFISGFFPTRVSINVRIRWQDYKLTAHNMTVNSKHLHTKN